MKPFSENAQCMKCGWKDIGVTWLSSDKEPERLVRYCLRCSFKWLEAPLNLLVPTGAEREGA